MTEIAEIRQIGSDDTEEFIKGVVNLREQVNSIDPANVQCTVTITVTKDGQVKAGVLGNDHDIAKMLMTLTQIVHHGMITAHTPTPDNEAKH